MMSPSSQVGTQMGCPVSASYELDHAAGGELVRLACRSKEVGAFGSRRVFGIVNDAYVQIFRLRALCAAPQWMSQPALGVSNILTHRSASRGTRARRAGQLFASKGTFVIGSCVGPMRNCIFRSLASSGLGLRALVGCGHALSDRARTSLVHSGSAWSSFEPRPVLASHPLGFMTAPLSRRRVLTTSPLSKGPATPTLP